MKGIIRMKPKSGTTVAALDLPEKAPCAAWRSWRPWEVLERLVGGLAVVAAIALLPGCGIPAFHPDAWNRLPLLAIGLLLGAYFGRVAEAAKWRSKGECPPQGGGRMPSGGRFYWVCAEDADEQARRFVAQMLLDAQEPAK